MPKFFSIAAADAEAIDPQQRLLLEVCYEALESGMFRFCQIHKCRYLSHIAGCTNESIDGTDTSVFVGSFVKGAPLMSLSNEASDQKS